MLSLELFFPSQWSQAFLLSDLPFYLPGCDFYMVCFFWLVILPLFMSSPLYNSAKAQTREAECAFKSVNLCFSLRPVEM